MAATNPCLACGACCACYKVSMDASEVDNVTGGIVPIELTVFIGNHRYAMRGTEKRPRRCAALEGTVGLRVGCSIYENRPGNCRSFLASWQENIVNPYCDRARILYGMQAFSMF